jgi:2-dehydro-3-deoxygluconokinase
MKELGRTVSLDPNLIPTLWTSKQEMIEVINQFAMKADYFLPGISEGEILTGYKSPRDIASFYLDKGVELVVIKLGEEGAYYKNSSEEGLVNPYEVKEVVDTVGAGDGFAVGVISGLLENLQIKESVLRGNAIGSMAVQFPGDNDGYPNRDQLMEFMKLPIQGVN